MFDRVACIGVGNVGATCAYTLLTADCAREIILVDIDEERCKGHAQDLTDARAFHKSRSVRTGTYAEARNADFIIISAGSPQGSSNQDRCNLAQTNGRIINDICKHLDPLAEHSVMLVITNPVDIMTYVAQRALPYARDRIIGSGTWLDTQRLRAYLSHEIGISPQSIQAYVVGEHGDDQVAVWSHATTSAGTAACNDEAVQTQVAEATKQRAYQIIQNKGATYYGVARCAYDIGCAVAYDEKRIVPVSTYLSQYDMCLSMPTVLGGRGAQRTISLTLAPKEQEQLVAGAHKLRNTYMQCHM